MRFSASAFAPACASPNHCETDPLRLYPDASGGEAAVTRYRVFPGMELDYRDVHARACRELRDGSDRKSTRLNSSHIPLSRMPSSA